MCSGLSVSSLAWLSIRFGLKTVAEITYQGGLSALNV
jgi:hypothetical protein